MAETPTIALPQPGEIVAGKYRVQRAVGSGGMGVVFEAVHVRLRQRVAIKVLLPRFADNAEVITRFEREARAAGQLTNRHVARVVDVDHMPSGLPYMVMELLDGRDVASILRSNGRLPVGDAVDYILQTCAAMAEAHSLGIVHRDLKPSNLFLCGDERTLKVLDFGISKVRDDDEENVTSSLAVVGTPIYMSPEQVRSARTVDARTDIWSIGVILFELLAGRVPFQGSTTSVAAAIVTEEPPDLRTFRADVPDGLWKVIQRCLSKDPAQRFKDARAVAAALQAFGSGSHTLDTSGITTRVSMNRVSAVPSEPTPDSVGAIGNAATMAQGSLLSSGEHPAISDADVDRVLPEIATVVSSREPRTTAEVAPAVAPTPVVVAHTPVAAPTSPGWSRTAPSAPSARPWRWIGGAVAIAVAAGVVVWLARDASTGGRERASSSAASIETASPPPTNGTASIAPTTVMPTIAATTATTPAPTQIATTIASAPTTAAPIGTATTPKKPRPTATATNTQKPVASTAPPATTAPPVPSKPPVHL